MSVETCINNQTMQLQKKKKNSDWNRDGDIGRRKLQMSIRGFLKKKCAIIL